MTLIYLPWEIQSPIYDKERYFYVRRPCTAHGFTRNFYAIYVKYINKNWYSDSLGEWFDTEELVKKSVDNFLIGEGHVLAASEERAERLMLLL
jgi:hypothetical protein